jgi:hypothetical protein
MGCTLITQNKNHLNRNVNRLCVPRGTFFLGAQWVPFDADYYGGTMYVSWVSKGTYIWVPKKVPKGTSIEHKI